MPPLLSQPIGQDFEAAVMPHLLTYATLRVTNFAIPCRIYFLYILTQ